MAGYEELQAELDKIAKEENIKISTSTVQEDTKYKKRDDLQTAVGKKSYTVFASGLMHGGRDVELKNKNTRDNLAIIFDAVDNHSYRLSVDKTKYATENKVNFADHAIIEDGVFSFTGRVSSAPVKIYETNYFDKDTDKNNPLKSKRPQKAQEAILEIIRTRELVSIVSEDAILENYICTSMEAVRDGAEGDALIFQLEFEEFRTFTLGKTVLATNFSDAKKSPKKQKGAVSSSSTGKEVDVMKKRSVLQTDLGKKISSLTGLDDYTSTLQKTGTYNPTDGSFKDLDGNDMKF